MISIGRVKLLGREENVKETQALHRVQHSGYMATEKSSINYYMREAPIPSLLDFKNIQKTRDKIIDNNKR